MKDDGAKILIGIVLVIGTIGALLAFVGIIASTAQIMKENMTSGIVVCILDLALIVFVAWAIREGVVKPLIEVEKKKR